MPRRPDGGIFVKGVLQLDDAQRKAVDEQHDVGTAFVLVLGDRELVDGQPIVVSGVVEVDDANLVSAPPPVSVPILDFHAIDQHQVKGAVAGFEGRSLGMGQLAVGVFQGRWGKRRVECDEGIAQPPLQHHLIVGIALGGGRIRSDVGAVNHGPAEVGKPAKRSLLDVRFGEGSHGVLRLESRSGMVRLAPRGMFSNSH